MTPLLPTLLTLLAVLAGGLVLVVTGRWEML